MSPPDGELRILYVGYYNPTGLVSGSSMRFLGVLEGMSGAGRVDYLQRRGRSWRAPGWRTLAGERPVPDGIPIAHWYTAARLTVPHRWKGVYRYVWAPLALCFPKRVVPLLAARAPRIDLRHQREVDVDAYDVMWFFKLESALAFRDLLRDTTAATIVDLDDLVYQDRDNRRVIRTGWGGYIDRLRERVDDKIDALDRQAWEHWRNWVANQADLVTLSNPSEGATLRDTQVTIVSNGYDVPARRGFRPAASPPVLLFVGWMHYFPNRDGAQFLVHEVLPFLRERLGPFHLRIVGNAPVDVVALANDNPEVTVTGFVDDLGPELANADVVVVPLRHGSGTRLKILEAFAHEIPVVSTPIGADGLDVVDGEDLLLADDPESFADACVRLLHDERLRARLTDNAYEVVTARYSWRVVGDQIADVVRLAATGRQIGKPGAQ